MFESAAIIFGLLVGSFVNAVVWRLHLKQSKAGGEELKVSITRGRSVCTHCGHRLAAIDLIPVLSWLALWGRCRYCRKQISWQYPAVELLTAGLFFALTISMPHSTIPEGIELALWLYFGAVLVTLAVYDLRWYLLPDVVLLPAIGLGLARLAIVTGSMGAGEAGKYLAAAITAGGAFYAIAAFSNGKWMGGGDIKLAFFMGLVLGPAKAVLAMLLAFNSAAVIGLALIALKLKSRRDYIPFGPFLAGSTVVSWLAGERLLGWYLRVISGS
jgi:leader peptidase (prepilin peptidase) / N-methyltransferase